MAAAATMFAACTQSDFVNEVPEEAPQAIGFESYIGKSTRTEYTNDESLHGAGFKVWGYTTEPQIIFDGAHVTWGTPDAGKWNCSETRYWDKNATYNFYATAPKNGVMAWDNTNGKFTITDAKSGVSTEADVIDYLTATKLGVTRAGNGDNTVEFNFGHVMSKVAVKLVKKSTIADAQALYVTNVTMTGWDGSLGNYDSKGTPSVWTLETPATAGSAVFVDTKTAEIGKTETEVATEYLIVPQTIAANGLVFTVSYELGGITYNAQTAKLTTEQVWAPNQFTTYTLTIGPEVIEFGTQVVDGWNSVDGGTSVQ